jgi:hypothetical protein
MLWQIKILNAKTQSISIRKFEFNKLTSKDLLVSIEGLKPCNLIAALSMLQNN